MSMSEVAPRITVDPNICFGTPVVTGTRVHVAVVLGALASGLGPPELLREYGITQEDIYACLAYAAQKVRGGGVRAVS
jgi:uncharacterized protein (DUF433 family)